MSDSTEFTAMETEMTESLENLIEMADRAREAAEAAQIEYEKTLLAIKNAHGATFQREDGSWYQIRHRKDSVQGRPITYLCALKGEPKTWLKGPKGKKAADSATVTSDPTETQETVMVASVASTVSETGGTVVID